MKQLYLLYILLIPLLAQSQVPKYSSRPSATSVVFLDFDGHKVENTSWNSEYEIINAAPSGLSEQDIYKIYRIVREDFITLNVNITTDPLYYEQASIYSRHRVIITPTSYWSDDEGSGVAVIGSFAHGDETPSFVFADRLANHYYNISQIVSHEIGHALGLYHIAEWNEDCTLEEEYKGKKGNEFPTFSPIMGSSYDSDITGWVSDFNSIACDQLQDEVNMFHTGQFGFIPVPDDIADNFANAKEFSPLSAHVTEGVISDSNDVDVFKINLSAKQVIDIDVTPNRINKQTFIGINFIPEVDLYNSDSVLIRTYQNPTGIDVFIDTILDPGVYYFAVRAVGGENLPFYSSYGSYEFLYLVKDIALNDFDISLNGKQKGFEHELSWSFNGDGTETIYLQYSLDGINFSSLFKDSLALDAYSWKPDYKGNYFYRVCLLNQDGELIGYSNIIRFNSKNHLYRLLYNMIQNKIELISNEKGQYELIDVHGRVFQKGMLTEGYQTIHLQNKPKGVLLLRILQKGSINVEKLIVQ